jgi:hypothetical protein
MQQPFRSPSAPWRHRFWLAILVAASLALTLGLACAVPFAAFAATAALTLTRRQALAAILAVWLTNQLVGFTVLDYPWTADAFAWGAVLGVVVILATLAGQWTVRLSTGAARAIANTATFLVAFAVYEAALFTVSATLLGGTEIYTAAIQGRIFAVNAVAFVGLLLLHRLGMSIWFAARPGIGPSLSESRA